MTPLLNFFSQLGVRGKPRRLYNLVGTSFCNQVQWGAYWEVQVTECHRFRQLQGHAAAKHLQASGGDWKHVQLVERCLTWEASVSASWKATEKWEEA